MLIVKKKKIQIIQEVIKWKVEFPLIPITHTPHPNAKFLAYPWKF